MKAVKKSIEFLFFYLLLIVLVIYYSIKYIVSGARLGGQLAIVALYIGAFYFFFNIPLLFWILIILFAGVLAFLTVEVIKTPSASAAGSKTQSEHRSQEENTANSPKPSFFSFDLPVEEAKKKHRKLMKHYHPDSPTGDTEMAKKINQEYEQYCSSHGCK